MKKPISLYVALILANCIGQTARTQQRAEAPYKYKHTENDGLGYEKVVYHNHYRNFAPIHEAAKRGDVETMKGELAEGVPVDLQVKNQGGLDAWRDTTPLMWAAARGQLRAVRFLINSDANVNAANVKGTTPLMAAAGAIKTTDGDPLACVQALIEAGASVAKRDDRGHTALFYACGYGRTFFDTPPDELLPIEARLPDPFRFIRPDTVGSISAGPDVPSQVVYARYGDAARVKALLEAGAVADALTERGSSVLSAAASSADAARLRLLIEANVDIQRTNGGNEWNALKSAALYGTGEMFELLLKAGSKIQDGTMIYAAASQQDASSKVELLLETGADPNEKSVNGPALVRALARRPDTTDAASVLIAAGADYRVQSNEGESIHYLAAKNGSTSLLRRLLLLGLKADDPNVLVLAASSRHQASSKVSVLLAAGASIDASTDNGLTPLLAASKAGNMDVVIELANRGAEVNAEDSTGTTALMHVANRGSEFMMCEQTGSEAAKVLIEKGAKIGGAAGRSVAVAAARCDHWEVLEVLVEARKSRKQSLPQP